MRNTWKGRLISAARGHGELGSGKASGRKATGGKRGNRTYSDAFVSIIKAELAAGLPIHEIMRLHGVSRQWVYDIREGILRADVE